MPPKATRTSSTTAQLRSHSRSSSATKVGANLQFTQKDNVSAKGSEKSKKAPHVEGGRPGFPRAHSSQRVPSATSMKRTGSTTSAGGQHKAQPHATNVNAKANTGFTLQNSQTTDDADDDDDDDDEWVSSSGAQTPNNNDSDSDTASEGSNIPQELVQQLQRTQLEQHKQEEAAAAAAARAQVALPRVQTARQSDFSPSNGGTPPAAANSINGPGVMPKSAPPAPSQMPFPTVNSEPSDNPNSRLGRSSKQRPYQAPVSGDFGGDSGGGGNVPGAGQSQSMREADHSRSESRQTHPSSSKRQSLTRAPSTHSVSSRLDNMRPHPLIRGNSQGYLNLVPKPSPLAPLTVITDQPTNQTDNISTSPESIKTTSGVYAPEFPLVERRTSISSTRSVATLPATQNKPYDRARTLSTMSLNPSSSALNSLAHLPSVTRPPSPQQISFFPPVNPHINIEAIHPLLPGPYLNNHLTVLARRTPLRESYDRVMQAKVASGLR